MLPAKQKQQKIMSEFLHCRKRSKCMKYLMDDTTMMKKHKNITVIHNIIKDEKLFFYITECIKNVGKATREEECCKNFFPFEPPRKNNKHKVS